MDYLKAFRKQHLINEKATLSNVEVAVNSVYEANEIAYNYIAYIDNRTPKEGFIVHTHINLLGRVFEQVEGMLVSIVTNCPTSSEALGRIVIEGSINLMYMSALGNEKTIVAFFNSWVSEHRKKLNQWKQEIAGKEHCRTVEPMIDERIKVIDIYSNYVSNLVDLFNVNQSEYAAMWPKSIFKRFEALNLKESYYQNYHRLSGSSHITAEDTISWMLMLQASEEDKHALGVEAVSYSIMMSRLSCLFFLDAVAMCCISHGMRPGKELNKIKELKNKIAISVKEIANAAGVPLTK